MMLPVHGPHFSIFLRVPSGIQSNCLKHLDWLSSPLNCLNPMITSQINYWHLNLCSGSVWGKNTNYDNLVLRKMHIEVEFCAQIYRKYESPEIYLGCKGK